MRIRFGRFAAACTLGLGLGLGPVANTHALEGLGDNVDADIREWYSELRQMVDGRDMDKYEFDFMPLRMERIVLKDREGQQQVYHYLTFRLRNRLSDVAKYVLENRKALGDVMTAITDQFNNTTFDASGPRLYTDAQSIQDKELATIVESQDLKTRTRRANITVTVQDENGTRFKLFDPPEDSAPAAAEDGADADADDGKLSFKGRDKFNFADRGDTREGNVYHRVRERIEERESMRLLSMHQIRRLDLPPYEPNKLNEEGVAIGEVYGVLIFDRLPTQGDFFTIQVNGLSNKIRTTTPDHARDEVADYINTRRKRRAYIIKCERKGDEFFLDQDRFTIRDFGWRWVPAFVRIRHRASIAYTKYFLDNHPLTEEAEEPENRAEYPDHQGNPSPVLHNKDVHAAFMQYLAGTRSEISGLYDQKIERNSDYKAKIEKFYEEQRKSARVDEEDLVKRQQNWANAIDERGQQLQKGKDFAASSLKEDDFEGKLKVRLSTGGE